MNMKLDSKVKRALCICAFVGLLGALAYAVFPEIGGIGSTILAEVRGIAGEQATSDDGREPVEIVGRGPLMNETDLLQLGIGFLAGIGLSGVFWAYATAFAAGRKEPKAEVTRADWWGPIKPPRPTSQEPQPQAEPEKSHPKPQPVQTKKPAVQMTPVCDSTKRRIKQLTCFYGLSRLIEPVDVSLERIFEGAVELIRDVYEEPESIGVRITFKGIQYKTDNFRKSEVSQYAEISVRGEKAGEIDVYCLAEKDEGTPGPFVEEDRNLLNAVAERLSSVAEREQAAERLELFRGLIDRSNDCIFVIEA